MKIQTVRAPVRGRKLVNKFLAALMLQLLLSFAAHAAGVTVCAMGCSYTTIQAAINTAVAGEEIRVIDDSHSESTITVDRNITIQGLNDDPTQTLLLSVAPDTFITVLAGATLTLRGVTVSNGNAGISGGALIVSSGAAAVIDHCVLSHNNAGSSGGAIFSDGPVTISNSILSQNSAGGAPQLSSIVPGSGGAIMSYGALSISNTTLANNSAIDGFSPGGSTAGTGGAIDSAGALTVSNSTLAANSASDAGGIFSVGVLGGSVTVSNSTVSNNTGTGLWSLYEAVTIKSTIFASNSAGDCKFGQPSAFSSSDNLADDASCGSGFTQASAAQLNLGALAVNAPGTSATIALLPNSVAINAASNCLDAGGAVVIADQRGVLRPQGGACDIGAYEVVPVASNLLLSSANASSAIGTPVDITATLTGAGTPTGSVAFCADAAAGDATFCQSGTLLCGAAALSAGIADCSSTALTIGTHSITASYSGDGSNLPATAAAGISFQVTLISQAITAFSPLALVTFGDPAQLLSASGGGGSSAVVFSVVSGPCLLDGASLSYTGAGTCSIAADQAGDATHSAAPQLTATVTIDQASQMVTFGAPPAIAVGGSGSVTAGTSATPAANYPITFSTASTDCSVTTIGLVTGIAAGSNNCVVLASQAGGANFAAASATQTLSIGAAGSAVMLTSSINPSTQGAAVTFVATVTASAPARSTNALAGVAASVTFSDNGAPLGTVQLGPDGSASLTTSTLQLGPHAITAAYSGDANTQGSSAALTQTVVAVVVAAPIVAIPSLSSGALALLGLLLALLAVANMPGATRRAGDCHASAACIGVPRKRRMTASAHQGACARRQQRAPAQNL